MSDDKPRRRRLSDEDRALWDDVTRSITPLLKRRAPRRASEQAAGTTAPIASKRPASPARPASKPQVATPPALQSLPRRLKQQIARGSVEIEARLDLHGRTQSEAHAALLRFLRRAQADGAKTVLVITGKGGADLAKGRGVLRRQVPLWLELPDLRGIVLGFENAHAAHGGAGALYVRLRRGRSLREF
jgi:DNA-nicking Smr family endonuclease